MFVNFTCSIPSVGGPSGPGGGTMPAGRRPSWGRGGPSEGSSGCHSGRILPPAGPDGGRGTDSKPTKKKEKNSGPKKGGAVHNQLVNNTTQ